MPINIAPIDITVEEVTHRTVTADKLHILKLTISDPTKEKPSIELQCVPYAEDDKGIKQFGIQITTIRTNNLYGAIPNLAEAGFTKVQEAMEVVFAAAAEMVKYQADRQQEVEAIKPELEKVQAAYQMAVISKDDSAIKEAQIVLNEVSKKYRVANAAANDPSNSRIKE